jgi:hypothetical protein
MSPTINYASPVYTPVEPTPAKIHIRLQYTKDKPDDVLVLEPDNESSGFNVTFFQNTTSMKTSHWIDYDDVVSYLESFFTGLKYDYDAESCTYIQVEIPGLPCVLLKKHNAVQYLHDVVEDYLDDLFVNDEWPMESVHK